MQNVDSIRVTISFCDASITTNSFYLLAVIEDDRPKFIICEIDSYFRTPNEAKLKSFHTLNSASLLSPRSLTTTDGAQLQYRMHAMDNKHAFFIYNSNTIVSFTGPNLEMTGESKFNTLGDKLIASNFFENYLIFFSLNHGILKAKDNPLRLSIEEESIILNQTGDGNHSMDTGASSSYSVN